MGKAGYIVGIIGGVIVVLLGLMFLLVSFTAPGLSSWFSLFVAMFLFIISAIIFYAASRAKPKRFNKY
jgi:hypothetical protein